MSEAPVTSYRLDWPSAIGHFLLNFGTLEYVIAVFLKDHLESSEYSRFKNKSFNDRVIRITQYLNESHFSDNKCVEFAGLVRRLDPARELRNHIAHGYMCMSIDEEGGRPTISIVQSKHSDLENSPETRHLTFDELRDNLAELTEVIEAFKALAGFSSSK